MAPARLRECLDIMRWTNRGFAKDIERDEHTVRRYLLGLEPVPNHIAAWVDTVAAFMAAHPPPPPPLALPVDVEEAA